MKRILSTLAMAILMMGQADAASLNTETLSDADVSSYTTDEIAIVVTYNNGTIVRMTNDGTFRIMEVDYTGDGFGTEGAIVGEKVDMEKLGVSDLKAVSYDEYTYYSFTRDNLIVRMKADSTDTIREVSHIVIT